MRIYTVRELRDMLDADIIEFYMLSLEQAAAVQADMAAEEAAWFAPEHQAYLDELCTQSW